MIVKFKKLFEDSVIPTYANPGDAGLDLTARSYTTEFDEARKLVLVYHTGVAVKIPDGYVGLLFMRSSVSKKSLSLCNAAGVIDSGYTGEILLKYKVTTDSSPALYNAGDKIGQLVIVPCAHADVTVVDALEETVRGNKGFGSSDKK